MVYTFGFAALEIPRHNPLAGFFRISPVIQVRKISSGDCRGSYGVSLRAPRKGERED